MEDGSAENRKTENDDEAILRGKAVTFGASSVKRVFVVLWSPPSIIMLVTATAIVRAQGKYGQAADHELQDMQDRRYHHEVSYQ